jgi:multidrug efflux pump subunit AcrB
VETSFNGKPAISIETYRVGKQSTLEIFQKVKQFMKDYQPNLPNGLSLGNYNSTAEVVDQRLSMLLSSAIYGGILVFILLALFLRPAVAFWVGLGIPVCFLGGIAMMPVFGLSMNMLTMFAFLLVLGIVVDDAIVTGA